MRLTPDQLRPFVVDVEEAATLPDTIPFWYEHIEGDPLCPTPMEMSLAAAITKSSDLNELDDELTYLIYELRQVRERITKERINEVEKGI